MTNGQLLAESREVNVASEMPHIHFLSPNFISEDLSSGSESNSEQPQTNTTTDLDLANIVYPIELQDYRLPYDLGSYLFWNTYQRAKLILDCEKIGIPNSGSLLNLCDQKDACSLIMSKGLATKRHNGQSSGSDSDREEEIMPVVTLSAMQLCRKLRKVDPVFEFEFVNETFDDDEDCVDRAEEADISPVKHQKWFVGEMISDIFEHHS